MIKIGFIILAFSMTISSIAYSGSGRTDSNGCHYHRGVYVCH